MRVGKARQELVRRFRLGEAAGSVSPEQGLTKYLSLLGEYIARNPVALATATALTLGGLLLLGFFLRIGFMPDVDLAGSMALLFAAALVGIGTLVALVVASVLPGVGMRFLLDHAKIPLNWSSTLIAAGPAVLLVTFTVLSPLALKPESRVSTWATTIGYLLLVLAAAIGLLLNAQHRGTIFSWYEKIWPLVLCSFSWALGLFQVLQAALQIATDSPHPLAISVFFLGWWLFMIGSINVVLAQFPLRVSLVAGPIAGTISLIFFAMLTSSYSTVSATTVKALGIGELPSTTLMLTSDMCQALNATPGTLHCEPMADKATAGVLKDVTILSRIGSNVVVEGLSLIHI